MGRYPYSSRWTIEECKPISITVLNKQHFFDGGIRWGESKWIRNGKENGSIGFSVSTVEGDEYIHFRYMHINNQTSEKTELDYKARLVWTSCHYGGRRWWFICPLVVNGQVCNRRVGVLYLANDKCFGCRHCYNLTYWSCRRSRHFDSVYKGLGMTPKAGKAYFKKLGYKNL